MTKRTIFLFLVTVLCQPLVSVAEQLSSIRIIEKTPQSITLELASPPVQIIYAANGETDVHLAEFHSYISNSGAVLPAKARLIGIPEGAAVSIEVLGQTLESISGIHLKKATAPSSTRSISDVPVFAKVGFIGKMRDQAVAQILFTPVHYEAATAKLTIAKRLRVQVTFDRSLETRSVLSSVTIVKTPGSKVENDPFESMMRREIINYSDLGR